MPKSDKRVSDRVLMQNAVKTLAANIRFASVDRPVRTIVVTSSVPNEGKSTIAIELASAMASDDKSVLLVECDMRRRNLAAMIGAHARHGIYSVLSGQVELSDAVVRTATPGVFFLDSEPNIPSPVDILSSHSFRSFVEGLGQDYDYVIFDTPPLSAFVDASVISSVADGTLLVVREDYVKRDDLAAAYEQLQAAKANVIGAVLNYCEASSTGHYYSYYSSGEKADKGPSLEYSAPKPQEAPVAAAVAAPAPKEEPALKGTPKPKAAPAPKAAPQPAAPKADDDAEKDDEPALPGLRPFPAHAAVKPDSTAEFLVNTRYASSSYLDE